LPRGARHLSAQSVCREARGPAGGARQAVTGTRRVQAAVDASTLRRRVSKKTLPGEGLQDAERVLPALRGPPDLRCLREPLAKPGHSLRRHEQQQAPGGLGVVEERAVAF
jgi:hypothetical protein